MGALLGRRLRDAHRRRRSDCRSNAYWTSASYWKALFIPPVAGRYFTDEEDREGGPRVVMLSYALWQNRFNGDRSIVGRRRAPISGNPYTVVGVAPAVICPREAGRARVAHAVAAGLRG